MNLLLTKTQHRILEVASRRSSTKLLHAALRLRTRGVRVFRTSKLRSVRVKHGRKISAA